MADGELMDRFLAEGIYSIAPQFIQRLIDEYQRRNRRRLNQAEEVAIRDIVFEGYRALEDAETEEQQNEVERILAGLVRDFFRTGVAPITRPIPAAPSGGGAAAPPEDRGIRGAVLPDLGDRTETGDPAVAGRVGTDDPASRRGSITNPLNPR